VDDEVPRFLLFSTRENFRKGEKIIKSNKKSGSFIRKRRWWRREFIGTEITKEMGMKGLRRFRISWEAFLKERKSPSHNIFGLLGCKVFVLFI